MLIFRSARGCMPQIWLWCDIIMLRYDVMQLGLFWHVFFRVRYGVRLTHRHLIIMNYYGLTKPAQHKCWKQQNFQTHIADLLKLQYIQNSYKLHHLIYQFYWIWLQKTDWRRPILVRFQPNSNEKLSVSKVKSCKADWECNVVWTVIILLNV